MSRGRNTTTGLRCRPLATRYRAACSDDLNAVAERFFPTVKSELPDRFDSFGEAKMELFDYLEVFYNQQRRHSTIGRISVAAFERRFSAQAA